MPLACQNFPGADHIVLEEISSAAFPSELETSVSVIIPTCNAGPGFDALLDAIHRQRKVRNVEILVLDSGSTDDTVGIATAMGARVEQVNPASFSHGGTRNLGGGLARGDYLVFLVQDAVPLNVYWLYRLLAPLELDPDLVALSTRQVLPQDESLVPFLARWDNREINTMLDAFGSGDYALTARYTDEWWDALPDGDKRRLPFFDDVCSCVRKSFFLQEPFQQLVNAEDMEYGFRLLRKGYKLGFIKSTGVIHFHARGPEHQLKTQYLGVLGLEELLHIFVFPEWKNIFPSLAQLRVLFFRQLRLMSRVLSAYGAGADWESEFTKLVAPEKEMFPPDEPDCCPEVSNLRSVLRALFGSEPEYRSPVLGDRTTELLMRLSLRSFWLPFCKSVFELGRQGGQEFVGAVSGIMGRFWGVHLACFALWNPDAPGMEEINVFLEGGVCRRAGILPSAPGPSLAVRLPGAPPCDPIRAGTSVN